jgi:uncharacterized protein YcfJ
MFPHKKIFLSLLLLRKRKRRDFQYPKLGMVNTKFQILIHWKERVMKSIFRKNRKKRSVAKVVTGIVLGSVFGAVVGLLMAPTSGRDTLRRITGQIKGVREKAKTAEGNVESRARDLMAEINEGAGI